MDRELNELSRSERLRLRGMEGEDVTVRLTARLVSVGSKAVCIAFPQWDETSITVELDPNRVQEVNLA